MTGTSRSLMMAWSWAVILFGLLLAGAGFAATDGAARHLFGLLGSATPIMDPPLRFAAGLMGAVTMGWGLTVLAIASVGQLMNIEAARPLWRRMTAAAALWYVVDGVISIATGFGMNVVSNTVLMVAFVLIAWRAGVLATTKNLG